MHRAPANCTQRVFTHADPFELVGQANTAGGSKRMNFTPSFCIEIVCDYPLEKGEVSHSVGRDA